MAALALLPVLASVKVCSREDRTSTLPNAADGLDVNVNTWGAPASAGVARSAPPATRDRAARVVLQARIASSPRAQGQ